MQLQRMLELSMTSSCGILKQTDLHQHLRVSKKLFLFKIVNCKYFDKFLLRCLMIREFTLILAQSRLNDVFSLILAHKPFHSHK